VPINIPQDYRHIQTKINFGTWYYQLHQGITKVTNTMGQYGTKHEPYIDLSIRKSTTTKKAGYHYCPLTAVKELFLKTSQIRQQIITIWTTIDGLLAQFITK
jgi:hypothetical protein